MKLLVIDYRIDERERGKYYSNSITKGLEQTSVLPSVSFDHDVSSINITQENRCFLNKLTV